MPANQPLLVTINGPTAVGKTAQSIAVAKHFNTVILSSDSRQFYREMSIGTAKPTANELAQVEHYFIDSLSIHDEYSAGQYEREALALLDELFKTKEIIVLTGGSGLYTEAVISGFDQLPSDAEIRQKLNEIRYEQGIEPLQIELKRLDPEHYAVIDSSNPQRLIRALEVCRITGKKYSELRRGNSAPRNFTSLSFSLQMERTLLYERINKRVDDMLSSGLLDEAKTLLPYRELAALNTVGYKELFRFLDGQLALDEAVELIKQNTRRFAKRQITWLARVENNQFIDAGDNELLIGAIEEAIGKRKSS